MLIAVFLGTFAVDHSGAHLGRGGGPHEVLGVGAVRAAVEPAGVRPGRLLDLRRRVAEVAHRLARRAGIARLRRRHGDPRQRRDRRTGRRAGAGQAQGLAERRPPTPLDAAGDDRHRHPLVRLVRLQRRLGAGAPTAWPCRRSSTPSSRRRRPVLPGSSSSGSRTATSPTSALPRASWRAWWPSPRRAVSSPTCPRSGSGRPPVSSVRFAVHLKFKAGFDDSLDVVGVHFVGGLVGSLLIGFFADPGALGRPFDGRAVLRRGRRRCSLEQVIANAVTIVFSFVRHLRHPQGAGRHHRDPGVRGRRGRRARHLPARRDRLQPR